MKLRALDTLAGARNRWAGMLEFFAWLALAGMVFHLLTGAAAGRLHVLSALAVVVLGLAAAYVPWRGASGGAPYVWRVLSALLAGFWIFNGFRYLGWVRWPMARPDGLGAYAFLLYSHFVMVATVLSPMLLVGSGKGSPSRRLAWGAWGGPGRGNAGRALLAVVAAGLWIWAIFAVVFYIRNGALAGPGLFLFPLIVVIKACLTGGGEEVCFRGIVQPASVARFGLPFGLVFQAGLYALFHMHLGAAIVGETGFVFCVFVFGLAVGAVTRWTRGVGWAFTVHFALNVVIECSNLS